MYACNVMWPPFSISTVRFIIIISYVEHFVIFKGPKVDIMKCGIQNSQELDI